jgi:hypothetical protein
VGSYAIMPTLADPDHKLGNYALTINNGNLAVTPATLTVSVDNKSRSYGTANPDFTGAINGTQNGDALTLSLSTSATIGSPVGSYAIVPSVVDPGSKLGNYNVISANGILSITPALLTGTADDKSRVYGATNPVFTVTYSGFVNEEGAGIIVGALIGVTPAETNSPVGSYPISVSGQSAPNYTINYIDGTLTVTAAQLTVTADNKSRTYGAANPELTGTVTGVQEGDNITASYATTVDATSSVGTYPITISVNDPDHKLDNYTVITNSGVLTISPVVLSVTADNQVRLYGAANPELTGIISGIQNGDNITVSYATAADASSPVGSYAIVPTLADPQNKLGNYSTTTNNGTLTVNATALTVTAGDATRTYGAANPELGGIIVGIKNGDNITATYAAAASASSAVGSYAIVPTLADPDHKLGNYALTINNGNLAVTPATLTVSVDNKSRSYGTANPDFTGAINGTQNGDALTLSLSTSATIGSPVGSYAIVPSVVDPGSKLGNYNVISANGILSITPALLTGTADDKSRVYGATNPVFTVTYSGFVNEEGPGIIVGTLVGATPAETNSPVGSYPISVSGQSAPNYTINYIDGTLTVTVAQLTVTADDKSRAYAAANPELTGTVTGLQNGDSIVVSYNTTATSLSSVGNYPISPAFSDPAHNLTNYSVTIVDGTLAVTPAALSVSVADAARIYGESNPTLTGTLIGVQNSDNISAAYVCDATAGSPAGPYPINASLQDPDGKLGNYAITIHNGTLSVNRAALAVVVTDAARPYGSANPVFAGSISGLRNSDNVSAIYSSTATESSPVGSYAIVPRMVDPDGKLSNYSLTVQIGSLTIFSSGISSIRVLANHQVEIAGTGQAGSTYTVQATTDLVHWQDIGTAAVGADGTFQFVDPDAANISVRFYRAVVP